MIQKIYWKLIEIKDFFIYGIPNFLKNVWLLRSGLYRHKWYDHAGSLLLLRDSIKDISKNIEKKGNEIDEERLPKIKNMNRIVVLIDNYINDNYLKLAEKETGLKYKSNFDLKKVKNAKDLFELVSNIPEEQNKINDIVYKKSLEIAEKEWNELFLLLKDGVRNWWD